MVLLILSAFFFLPISSIEVKLPSLQGVYPPFIKYIPERGPSTPFISGDTFRWIADWKVDEFQEAFDTESIQAGDIIFVNTYNIAYFFDEVFPHITVPFILLTHNSDLAVPGDYASYLDNEKIIAWFGQNTSMRHSKLHTLPVGFANRYFPWGKPTILYEAQKRKTAKKTLVYLNITTENNPDARKPVIDYFKDKRFCFRVRQRKSFLKYLLDLKHSVFTISPPGNGIDCHRTYEALLMGSYPIVMTSPLDHIFEDLPVIIIQDWQEVTEAFLYKKVTELKQRSWNFKKLFAAYWVDQIRALQSAWRSTYESRN